MSSPYSFMKDLATLRNPGSEYTFLSYLHSEGRLLSFINRGSTIPTRKEYSDYLAWAAAKVQANGINVKFGHEITDLEEGPDNTILVRYKNLRTGEESTVRARKQFPLYVIQPFTMLTIIVGDLVISPGGAPKIPDVLAPFANHPRVRHSSGYATSIGATFDSLSSLSRPLRVAVVGSGQSAAEVTMDLRNRLEAIPAHGGRHVVDMLIRKGSLKPSDDSPFANEVFDPEGTLEMASSSSDSTDSWPPLKPPTDAITCLRNGTEMPFWTSTAPRTTALSTLLFAALRNCLRSTTQRCRFA